nr:uncharacterized protein LOC111503649 isoform X2 [Leptinotarsa decemlineata]
MFCDICVCVEKFLNVVEIVEIMTHYWWMHWFWITLWISLTICKSIPATIHSSTTDMPSASITVELDHSVELPRSSTNPPTTLMIPVAPKYTSAPKDTTVVKHVKSSFKKYDFLFPNSTSENKTKEVKVKETVINVMENMTDNPLLINSSLIAINRTDNLTYLEEVENLNQSSVQNSERLGVEENDDELSSEGNLSAAGITGITLGCVVTVGILSGISYFIYRNRGFNRPQVLNDRCSNPDSSGYIDDASDNSEEMYSLDNDSFLNSLEAMTIQNYWTDTVKHTKL